MLNYWIEGTSIVWIKIPTIPAGDKIFFKVSKSGINSPNGYNTFPFFSDTPGDWDAGSSETYSGSHSEYVHRLTRLQSEEDSAIFKNATNNRYEDEDFDFVDNDFEMVFRINSDANATRTWFLFLNDGSETEQAEGGVYRSPYLNSVNNRIEHRMHPLVGSGSQNVTESYSHNHGTSWVIWSFRKYDDKLEVDRAGTNVSSIDISEEELWEDNWGIVTNFARSTLGSTNSTWTQLDWVYMKKLLSNEPTIKVTDETTHYKLEIDNTGGVEITDYQVRVNAKDLNDVTYDESLEISEYDSGLLFSDSLTSSDQKSLVLSISQLINDSLGLGEDLTLGQAILCLVQDYLSLSEDQFFSGVLSQIINDNLILSEEKDVSQLITVLTNDSLVITDNAAGVITEILFDESLAITLKSGKIIYISIKDEDLYLRGDDKIIVLKNNGEVFLLKEHSGELRL